MCHNAPRTCARPCMRAHLARICLCGGGGSILVVAPRRGERRETDLCPRGRAFQRGGEGKAHAVHSLMPAPVGAGNVCLTPLSPLPLCRRVRLRLQHLTIVEGLPSASPARPHCVGDIYVPRRVSAQPLVARVSGKRWGKSGEFGVATRIPPGPGHKKKQHPQAPIGQAETRAPSGSGHTGPLKQRTRGDTRGRGALGALVSPGPGMRSRPKEPSAELRGERACPCA